MSIRPSFHLFLHPSIHASAHPSIPFFSSTYLVSCHRSSGPPTWCLLPVGQALKTCKGCAWKHPGQMPEQPQTGSFNHKVMSSSASSPDDVWASYLISKAKPSHPLEEPCFKQLVSISHPFSPIPKTMTIRESWNVYLLINWELFVSVLALMPCQTTCPPSAS